MSAVATIIRVFRHAPFPTIGSLAACRRMNSPVSRRAEFPGRREKSREFLGFSRSLRKSVSKTCAILGICELFPYAIEQGINSREQGINSAFWTGAGNLPRNRSARPDAYQAIRLPPYRDVSSSRTRGSRSLRPCLASRLRAAFRLTPSPHRGPTAGYPLSRVRHVLSWPAMGMKQLFRASP
jgi:hypothetical protein